MELNSEQIKKALECCADTSDLMKCQSCPYISPRSGCNTNLVRDALSLIKELTEECKKWQSRVEIECEYTKADTVRKMQEEISKTLSALCKGDVSEIRRMIDQIAKEMSEG